MAEEVLVSLTTEQVEKLTAFQKAADSVVTALYCFRDDRCTNASEEASVDADAKAVTDACEVIRSLKLG